MRTLNVSRAVGVLALVAMAGQAKADFQHAYFFGQSTDISTVGPGYWEANDGTYHLTTGGDQSGAMWHTERQHIEGGFVTTFQFSINPTYIEQFAGDGFAFVIQNDALGSSARGGAGSAIGYGPNFTSSTGTFATISNGIAIEFDTFGCCGDRPTPEVSIQTMNSSHWIDFPDEASLANAELAALGPSGIDILDGNSHIATVQYVPPSANNSTLGRLEVYVDDIFACGADVDLGAVALVGGGTGAAYETNTESTDFGTATVGFTAATGLADSVHRIEAWAFNGDTGACQPAYWWLAGNGSGCFVPDGPCGMGAGVTAQGTRPMTYTWVRNGAEILDDEGGRITGLGTHQIQIDPATGADSGYYRVDFSNACGSGNFGDIFMVPFLYCNDIDFNNDGLFPDTTDIDEFLNVFSGGNCSGAGYTCDPIDFNNDGLFPDTMDIDSFLSVFSGGACLR